MSEQGQPPRYMSHLLEQLGWNEGTRIPLADEENQALESQLITRQNEIQRLKEALLLQNQKTNDLKKYKEHVHSEYQENIRLLFAHKQQLEQEVKLQQLSNNEVGRLERDIVDSNKENKDISGRLEKIQMNISRLLKKADSMKSEVCGERGAVQEWRAALERRACDIEAIQQFTKQDQSKVKALDVKRSKLQDQHDKLEERLHQLISHVVAEEAACERVSVQVMEGMEQRKQMMQMWRSAVENLRQRDTDIRHTREDYAILEQEAHKISEQVREQQLFCEQQLGNNAEAQRENITLAHKLSGIRSDFQRLRDDNLTQDSEVKCLQREMAHLNQKLEKLRMENRRIIDEQRKKDNMLEELKLKMEELKDKIEESLDKSKSSEKRAKQLQEMLNEEEHYANQLTVNQQRAMHCSFVEQQKLLALKNEEKLFHMQLKASKAIMSKLETRKNGLQKNLQVQKESLYSICFQLETVGARLLMMEGEQADREYSAELVAKEERIRGVLARHAARVALLERHASMLNDDMRFLAREVDYRTNEHGKMKNRLKMAVLTCDGGEKELKELRETWRRERVEEALTRVRVSHATRAVAGLDDTAFSLDAQRLQLRAAMNERLVEISARRDMFNVQKRALVEDLGRLQGLVREREQRIVQLKKRYDIFIATLGKDDSGDQMTVAFFKIKFAAERAELREKGAALDADISRRERDVSALEATLRVVHAAHNHFISTIAPLDECTPEIQELENLTKQYYDMRDDLKQLNSKVAAYQESVDNLTSRYNMLNEKNKQLTVKHGETSAEVDISRERVSRQEEKLQNARAVVKQNRRRAKYLVENQQHWKYFQLSIWCRDYEEAAFSAFNAMYDACAGASVMERFTAVVAFCDLAPHLNKYQKKFRNFIERLISGSYAKDSSSIMEPEFEESVLTTSTESFRSGVSVASGYTKRLSSFRRTVALKVQEPALIDELPEVAQRSTVSLRVVTLGLREGGPMVGQYGSVKMARRRSKR